MNATPGSNIQGQTLSVTAKFKRRYPATLKYAQDAESLGSYIAYHFVDVKVPLKITLDSDYL